MEGEAGFTAAASSRKTLGGIKAKMGKDEGKMQAVCVFQHEHRVT